MLLSSFNPAIKRIVALSIVVIVANPLLNRLLAPEWPEEPESASPSVLFDPSVTDVIDYTGLSFLKDGEHMELNMGLSYILLQSTPRWFGALMEMVSPTTIGDNVTETNKK